jgi:hypothetical protein
VAAPGGHATRITRHAIPLDTAEERARCAALAARDATQAGAAFLYDVRRVPSVAIFEVVDSGEPIATASAEPPP